MSNEIYCCPDCMKEFNSNSHPPVVIDEERYCEACYEELCSTESEPTQAEVEREAAKREREYRDNERLSGVPKGEIRRPGW